jgi:hypothetical protein
MLFGKSCFGKRHFFRGNIVSGKTRSGNCRGTYILCINYYKSLEKWNYNGSKLNESKCSQSKQSKFKCGHFESCLFVRRCGLQGTVSSRANPTIASYNASVVKIYSATNSMARLKNRNYFSRT